jgi:hypothetical protein
MKKILVMFAALIMISGVTFAGEAPLLSTADMSVSLIDQVVKVRYRSDKAGKVKVSIYCNATGKEVFSEQIKKQANFIRPYNLSGLPYGEYSIVLEDEAGRAVERVNYSKKVVTVLSSIIELKSKDGVMVALFSKEATDVTVRVLNEAGEILLSKQTAINGQNSQAFNLKEIKGAVKIEVLNSENEMLQSKTVSEQVL